MESVRSAAIGLWFRSGTAHENPALGGISHLLEHMVFKGTHRRDARALAHEVERLGGSLDAYTTHEHTAFHARVPEDGLETAVDVLCDLAFHPRLHGRDLELERQVVLEEIARVEDTPDDLVFDLHAELLYGAHPYGAPILGRRDSVSEISVSDLRRLQARAFRPARLVVAAAGRVDHDALLDAVAARLPADEGTPAPEVRRPTPAVPVERRIERNGGQQVHIVAGAPGIAWDDPLRPALVVATTALGGGMSSRLFQRVREERGLAYSVFSFHSFYRRGGHAGAYVGTRLETAAAARDALLRELGELAASGLERAELEETRTQLKGQLLLSLESPSSRMHRLAATELYDEPWRSPEQLAARIDGVSAEDAALAASLLDPSRLAVLELSPA
jgi:predicted Zn-dependent peptidase